MLGFPIENASCVAETKKAILVEAPDLDDPTWIPQSQVTDESEVWKPNDEGTLVVAEWWAERQGWQ